MQRVRGSKREIDSPAATPGRAVPPRRGFAAAHGVSIRSATNEMTSVSGLDSFVTVTAYEVKLMRRQRWSLRLIALITDKDESSVIR